MAEAAAVAPLVIGVKRSTFRMHDPDADVKNADYVNARSEALQRDRWTCRWCQFASSPGEKCRPGTLEESGFLEMHHLDDDHGNNDLSNLATACPFCHEVHHAGNAGHLERAVLIWLPEMSHEALHRLCHASFAAIKLNNAHAQDAKSLYMQLAAREARVPEALRNLKTLGTALSRLPKDDYAHRAQALSGLRLLPRMDVFVRYIDWWAQRAWAPITDWRAMLDSMKLDFLKESSA